MHARNEILLVATYEDMYRDAVKIIEKNKYPISVIEGSMEQLDSICQTIETEKPSVVISRGGTFLLLSERYPSLILLEIQISAYDILRACASVNEAEPGAIAFLGFSNIVFGFDLIGKLLNKQVYSVNFFEREDTRTVARYIHDLAEKGVTYFVCDKISYHVASEMGLNAHLVRTQEEMLDQFLKQSLHLLEIKNKEQLNTQRYFSIVDNMDECIISQDKYQDKPHLNMAAKRFCAQNQITAEQLTQLLLSDFSDAISPKGPRIINLNKACTIAVTWFPLKVKSEVTGVITKFQDITQIQKLEEKIRKELSQKGLTAKYDFSDILYQSPVMERTIRTAKKFALSDSTVLIQAATGTGKELFAQSIHNAGARASHPFVAINCAALPENLLESELFGYVEGAFTGAKKGGKKGLIELAHTGTLFLDEIGDMPVALQTRFLRVIQEREVMRIGDSQIYPVDIRIIAATNIDLKKKVEEGSFREDLYYRLNILSLRLPTLDERPEDIMILVKRFIQNSSAAMGKKIIGLDESAREAVANRSYKGNVRELQGLIERSVVLADGPYITLDDLGLSADDLAKEYLVKTSSLDEAENRLIEKTLKECGYNYSKAARRLGISRSTLYRKLNAR